MTDTQPPPEFSRSIAVEKIARDETLREIEATPTERRAIAQRLGLLALDRLTARLSLRRIAGARVSLQGHFEADVVQACVVTLAPVAESLAEDFATEFAEANEDLTTDEIEVDFAADDPPEPIEGGRIDLGEAVVQQLAVSLDPFPRAPGAQLNWTDPAEGDEKGDSAPLASAEKANPFGVLAALKKDRG